MTADTLTAAASPAATAAAPQHAVIWTEIPVTDFPAAIRFYEALMGQPLAVEEDGDKRMAVFSSQPGGVAGHIYPGTPAAPGTGPTVHLALPGTVEESAARCVAAGGAVMGPVIEIPPGRFQYATDPDGNSIGLFESRA
ncbi:VOC family protein [Rhodovulum sp. DZ06]|uniref:VOC family protein n=1 Tax=Rhodovulum sp. DZ06 TaxID=3425126 RepID=UPI003D34C254